MTSLRDASQTSATARLPTDPEAFVGAAEQITNERTLEALPSLYAADAVFKTAPVMTFHSTIGGGRLRTQRRRGWPTGSSDHQHVTQSADTRRATVETRGVGRRTRLLSVVAAVLVAGLVATGTWLLTRDTDATDEPVASRPAVSPTPTPSPPSPSPSISCPEAKAEAQRLDVAGRRLQREGDAFPKHRHSDAEAHEFSDRLERYVQTYTDLVTGQSDCFGADTVAAVLAALDRLRSDNLY